MKKIIELLQSTDYKERFKGEYLLLKDKTEKLRKLLNNYELLNNYDNLEFEPSCKFDLLMQQFVVMKKYLTILEKRAKIENIILEEKGEIK